jgi:hypothetical protein
MFKSFNRKLVAAFCGLALIALPAIGADYIIDKEEIAPPPDAAANLTIRLTRAGAIVKADATVGGTEAKATFSPVTGEKTAIYFLLDISDHKDKDFPNAAKETVRQAADNLLARDFDVGLGTIGSKYTDWFYAIPEKVARDKAIDGAAAEKTEPTSELYRCSIEGLDKLASVKGVARKVLVILSWGKSNDTDAKYTADELIKDANRDGIAIFAVGYAKTEADTADWQSLRRIAKETGGVFIETDLKKKQPKQDLVIQLRSMLDSAAKVVVDLKGAPSGEQDLDLRLKLNDDRELDIQRKINVPTAAASVPPGPTPSPTPGPDGKPSTNQKWLWPAVIGGSALLVGLLAALIVKMTRAKPPVAGTDIPTWPDPNPAPNAADSWPQTIGNGTADKLDGTFNGDFAPPLEPETQYILGWLEQIDKAGSRGPRHAIAKSKLNIGRSSDSDLRLDDESVSIHHATIHRRSDRTLAITDLHSSNGIYVNAKRVEHSVLKDQDIIEIGEIRLKLSLNQPQR